MTTLVHGALNKHNAVSCIPFQANTRVFPCLVALAFSACVTCHQKQIILPMTVLLSGNVVMKLYNLTGWGPLTSANNNNVISCNCACTHDRLFKSMEISRWPLLFVQIMSLYLSKHFVIENFLKFY
jgi:hypothetical protein